MGGFDQDDTERGVVVAPQSPEARIVSNNPVDILKTTVGEKYYLPDEYSAQKQFPNIEVRTDRTGLPVFEKEARIEVVAKLNEVLEAGGEVNLIMWDGDGLKEANDRVSSEFGDANIVWGASAPLHELKALNLSCKVIVMRPEGAPDDTMVFLENPSLEDKEKIKAFVVRLNDPDSGIEITVPDNEGNPRIHTLSVTAGISASPADLREIARQRRRKYDATPDFSIYSDVDLDHDMALLKETNPEGYKYAVVEGLRQVADIRAHEAKGAKQLELAIAWLETLRGLSIEDFDAAYEARFGGSRESRVVRKLINDTRRERYLPSR